MWLLIGIIILILICIAYNYRIEPYESKEGDSYQIVGPDTDIPPELTGPFLWNNPTRFYDYSYYWPNPYAPYYPYFPKYWNPYYQY